MNIFNLKLRFFFPHNFGYPPNRTYHSFKSFLFFQIIKIKTLKSLVKSESSLSGSRSGIGSSSVPVYSRGNLSSSVSLFPTNSTTSANFKPISDPPSHNSVSIIPTSSVSTPSSLVVTSKSATSVASSTLNTSSPTKTSITPVTKPVTISPVVTANNNSNSNGGSGVSGSGGTSTSSLSVTPTSGPSSGAVSQESPNQNKPAGSLSPRSMGSNGAAKRLGRPPKKGTHIAMNSIGSAFSGGGAATPGDSEDGASEAKRLKTEDNTDKPDADNALPSGGEKKDGQDLHRLMMFGATLNPSSGMAKEMTSVLQVMFFILCLFNVSFVHS